MPAVTALEDEQEYVKAAWYGDSGTGKTTDLACLARLGPILFVDAESGIKPTALRRPDVAVPIDNIKRVRVTTYAEIDALVWNLREEFDQDPAAYFGICIDSITEMQAAMLAEEMDSNVRRAAVRGVERDPFAVEGADWQRNTEAMRRIIRGFLRLPCHVGFSALVRQDKDHDGVVTYGPQLTPKVMSDFIGFVDICLATQPVIQPSRQHGTTRRSPIYSAFTRRSGKWRAKDRFGVLPSQLVAPTFDRVIQYISGDLTRRTDEMQQQLRLAKEE